jgi:hypothetical protein
VVIGAGVLQKSRNELCVTLVVHCHFTEPIYLRGTRRCATYDAQVVP